MSVSRNEIIKLAHRCAQEAWRMADPSDRGWVRRKFLNGEPTLPHLKHADDLRELLGCSTDGVPEDVWATFRESYRAELRRQAFRGHI